MKKVFEIGAKVGEKMWGLIIVGAGFIMIENGIKIFREQ